MPVPLLLGAALAMLGAATFMVLMFSSGGGNKANQFRVIGELFRKQHGAGKAVAAKLSLVAIFLGSCTAFVGVGLMDAERAKACEEHCVSLGHEAGVIGASRVAPELESDAKAKGQPPGPACLCSGGGRPDTELPASSLPSR